MPEPSSSAIRTEFDQAVQKWERAQVVRESPLAEEYELMEQMSARPEDFHDLLVAALCHPSQLVAAYCLLALERMNSPVIESLPAGLLERREKITLLTGSFSTSMDLGGLARQLKRKRKNRES